MVTVLLATGNVHEAAAVCDYLASRFDVGKTAADAVVHAVGVDSAPDGDNRQADVTAESARAAASRDRADALNAVRSRLGGIATVETEDLDVDDPAVPLLERAREVDADEIVLGDATLARQLLDRTDRPLVLVPV